MMMKRFLVPFILGLLVAGAAGAQSRGSTMYAAAKTVALKSSTGFFASTRGTLAYGDQVTVLQVKGNWVEVQAVRSSLSGWTALTNLTSKRVVSSSASTSTTGQELALAGKGFSEEVERAYRAEGDLNYAGVDALETIRVSEQDLQRFIEEGHLAAGEQ
jgi:uncharacterized protein YgiM (DUF1202 family)